MHRALVAATCLALATASASAAEHSVRCFNIPAGPLGPALLLFAEQAELEVLIDADEITRVLAPEVHGNYRKEEALQRLLRCTGFAGEIRRGAVRVTSTHNNADCSMRLVAPDPLTIRS